MKPGDLVFISGTYFNPKVLKRKLANFRPKSKSMKWYMSKSIWERKRPWEPGYKKGLFRYLTPIISKARVIMI